MATSIIIKLAVVILAAGSSRRMAQPKLLLPWGSTSIAGHQIGVWEKLGAQQIAVVHAHGDAAILGELDRLNFPAENRIPNPAAREGMFSSIRCAAGWNGWRAGLTHWAITLGDQPHLRIETLESLLAHAVKHVDQVCQPHRLGHFRHPVVLPAQTFRQLKSTQARTLDEFLKKLPEGVSGCDLDDPGLDQDIDTPEDYQKVLAKCKSG